MRANTPSVAVIGFGEAGSSLCIGWNRLGVRSFDIKQTNLDLKAAKCAEMQDLGVEAAEDVQAAVEGLILSSAQLRLIRRLTPHHLPHHG